MAAKTVGIIGFGVVGKVMKALFEPAYNVKFYDKVVYSFPESLKDSDLIIISVPTPMSEDGSCDISAIEDAANIAIEYAPNALVCIKSAIPPGTTDYLNEKYKTDKFHVSPEYIGEGTRFVAPWKYPDPRDNKSHDFVIVGGPRASEVLDYFSSVMAVDARYIIAEPLEVELTKRFENAFLATKVTFVNEASNICDAYGVDWKKVRELWLLDARIGRSHTGVFKEEPGYGGKCLPKDMSALIHESEIKGYDPSLLRSVKEANDKFRRNLNGAK
jgi:UDPglucose 6-dehydrogenase